MVNHGGGKANVKGGRFFLQLGNKRKLEFQPSMSDASEPPKAPP